MSDAYVHGFSETETLRLICQAGVLEELIHADAHFAPGSRILEAGCGVGAQTVQLATRNPQSQVIAVDRSTASLEATRQRIAAHDLRNVELVFADLNELPFAAEEFDGAFVCFVLEHLVAREQALREIRRVLRPGSKLFAFEGDHGSVLASPLDPAIDRLVAAVSQYQYLQGGDPCIGRRLYAVLTAAGFRNTVVKPCIAYADASRPEWIEAFTRGTFIDMMKPQREAILERGLLSEREWHDGIIALESTTGIDGSFCYTFFRALAYRPE